MRNKNMDCKEGTMLMSDQMIDLLKQLDNEVYAKPLAIFNQSSIGQHFRHIIDFYNCLLNGCGCHVVDYCDRERNPLIEKDSLTAISVIKDINLRVQNIDEERRIVVKSDFSTNKDEERTSIESSLGRELMYAFDHALHHLALIKIGLHVHFPEIKVDENLGVAPSTIKYLNSKKVEQS